MAPVIYGKRERERESSSRRNRIGRPSEHIFRFRFDRVVDKEQSKKKKEKLVLMNFEKLGPSRLASVPSKRLSKIIDFH